MYQRSPSHGHNFGGQTGGRSIPRALALGHLCLEQLEGCLCCLPPAQPNPGLGVPSPWWLPVCWRRSCPAAIFLVVGVALVCLCSWPGPRRGSRGAGALGWGGSAAHQLLLLDFSFPYCKMGQWALLTRRLLGYLLTRLL